MMLCIFSPAALRAVSPTARIRGFRKQEVETEVAHLIRTPFDPLGELVLPNPIIFVSACLDVLITKSGEPFHQGS